VVSCANATDEEQAAIIITAVKATVVEIREVISFVHSGGQAGDRDSHVSGWPRVYRIENLVANDKLNV
jgi:hypothetical protein